MSHVLNPMKEPCSYIPHSTYHVIKFYHERYYTIEIIYINYTIEIYINDYEI